MAQETITVMVCDRCGMRLELRGDKSSREYDILLREASKWKNLNHGDIGGDHNVLLCPADWAAFQEFVAGSAVKSI